MATESLGLSDVKVFASEAEDAVDGADSDPGNDDGCMVNPN